MKRRIKINDTNWTIRVVSVKEMKKQREDGEHLAGLCIPSEKTIYIVEDNLDYPTILHELFHAYVSGLHLDDTNNIPVTELEEIYASWFTEKAEIVIKLAKKITKQLLKMKEEAE